MRVFWTIYVTGYLFAAILVLRGRALGVWVYGGAFAVDLSLWIYNATTPVYGLVWEGRASLIDMGFNLLDILLLAGLIWMRATGRLR